MAESDQVASCVEGGRTVLDVAWCLRFHIPWLILPCWAADFLHYGIRIPLEIVDCLKQGKQALGGNGVHAGAQATEFALIPGLCSLSQLLFESLRRDGSGMAILGFLFQSFQDLDDVVQPPLV